MNRPRPTSPTVLKFGGAALADGEGVRRAAELLLEWGGARPVAVVSALGGVTAQLERAARAAAEGRVDLRPVRLRHRAVLSQLRLDSELCDRHLAGLATILAALAERRRLSDSERDGALSFGERMSARIVAAHLRERGVEATPVDAYDLGLESDDNHGRARPLAGTEATIRRSLATVPGIPVVTGFVAVARTGALTTLGRNGSDLTAALLGAAIGAREVCFWKSVAGVMTADPAVVPSARPLARMSYADAAELARAGAGILHPSTLDPLEAAGIPARVRDVAHPAAPGTLIAAGAPAADPVAIALDASAPALTVIGAPAPAVRERLSAGGITVRAEVAHGGSRWRSFHVAPEDLARAARLLHASLLETEDNACARSPA